MLCTSPYSWRQWTSLPCRTRRARWLGLSSSVLSTSWSGQRRTCGDKMRRSNSGSWTFNSKNLVLNTRSPMLKFFILRHHSSQQIKFKTLVLITNPSPALLSSLYIFAEAVIQWGALHLLEYSHCCHKCLKTWGTTRLLRSLPTVLTWPVLNSPGIFTACHLCLIFYFRICLFISAGGALLQLDPVRMR